MTRRYVYDAAADCVVEVGVVRGPGLSPLDRYTEVAGQHEYEFNRNPGDGKSLIAASLARAERREWAHKKFGSESRWAE
jgi:hypothetical protein